MLKNVITLRNLLYTNVTTIPLFLISERAGGMKVPLSKMQCKIGHPRRRFYETKGECVKMRKQVGLCMWRAS